SLDSRYSSGLRPLLGALQNEDAARAFEKTYCKSLDRVEQDLRAYVSGDSVRMAVFDLKLADAGSAPAVEPNAGLAARLALAELLSNDRRTLGQAAAAYQSLGRDYENRWEVEQGWGEFCMRERRTAEALQHFARAAGLGCDDARVFLSYARALGA